RLLPVALLSLAAGCGPLTVPAVQRLPPDEQATVDASWDNLLAPPDRLDRETLLDVLVYFQLFRAGVDRLTMRSEKSFAGGRAVMTVRFDRADPSADAFAVDVYDRADRLVRSERYASEEVFDRVRALAETGPTTRATTGPATGPTADEVRHARLARAVAATRPTGR
ncbi:MAG TPA: hypothetical protein VF796_14210, partial [Humisphaera sp.]